MRKTASQKTLCQVLRYLRPYRPLVVLTNVLAAATVAFSLYVPILIGRAIDHIVGPSQVAFSPIFKILLQV